MLSVTKRHFHSSTIILSTLTCNDIPISILHSVLIFFSWVPWCRLSFKETLWGKKEEGKQNQGKAYLATETLTTRERQGRYIGCNWTGYQPATNHWPENGPALGSSLLSPCLKILCFNCWMPRHQRSEPRHWQWAWKVSGLFSIVIVASCLRDHCDWKVQYKSMKAWMNEWEYLLKLVQQRIAMPAVTWLNKINKV